MTTSPHLSIGIACLAGMLTVLSPCVLPVLPIIVGRSLQSHPWGPIALVAGLVGGFATVGSLLGVTATWLTTLTNGLRTVAIALLLILAGLAIFPTWSYRLWQALPWIHRLKAPPRIGLVGEFWLGTQLGLLWTPCAGPVLAGILVLAAAQHQVLRAFSLLVFFGIGAAIPLLAIAYGGRIFSQKLLHLRPHSATLQRVGGTMILATAISILLGWDIQVQLWLASFFPSLPL
ncbi:MAG: cytochrome c biogenesis protein CcdA [Acaryochloridaceae cyanobacterium CSU_3_4]|nr:cytochrome c biogenesis protein CcdA [Acaryochloridaceae cyanobacterium CSU_3_4]